MPTTHTHPPTFAIMTPRSCDRDFGRLFGDRAAELAQAVDADAFTAAVESLTTVAISLGTLEWWAPWESSASWESWASWDSWSGWAGTASPAIDPPRSFTLFGIREERPGPRWQALFTATWPAYRAWYLQDGDDARPDLATARAQLTRHMPELVSTWEAMVALTEDDEVAARMLTLWDVPAFAPGCSQAAQDRPRPDPGPQLRLQSRPVRVGRVLQRVHQPQGHRHQRLPVGSSGRDERRRARHLPDAWRAPELRTRVRDPPGRALPAGGREHGRGGTSRTRPTPGRRVVQPDHDGRHRCGGDRLRVTR